MHPTLPILAALAVFAKANVNVIRDVSVVAGDDPDYEHIVYLSDMCYPSKTHVGFREPDDMLAITSQSPFPCEQVLYIAGACFANGTTPIDFLAEQQCLCGSNYFEAWLGCLKCATAHGRVELNFSPKQTSSLISSVSNAECKGTPTRAFMDVSASTTIRETYTTDAHFSDTRVEIYWTGAPRAVLGEITGSATARQTVITDMDNYWYWISHGPPTLSSTPTHAKHTGTAEGNSETTSSATTMGGTPSETGDATSTAAGATSTGGVPEVRVAGGFLAVVIAAMAAL